MADLDFDLTVARDARGGCRLTLRGELDLGSAPRLEQALAEAGEADVLLDLRGLTFMDSTGVRVLLEAAERHGRLRVLAPAGGEARVTIDETGIAPLLPLVDDSQGRP